MSTQFEKYLDQKIKEAIPGVTPGLVLQVHRQGRKIADLSVGDVYPYYDLASLTKIIFTTTAMMKAYELKKWNETTTVASLVGWFPFADVKIVDLLNHRSGLVWWKDFYHHISLDDSIFEKWAVVARILREQPLQVSEKSVYSDVGFLTLAFVLESLYEAPLMDIWTDLKQEFFPGSTLEFHENNEVLKKSSLYAPTERCQWRGRLLQGQVHDENAWSLGGVSTHAGLFGSVDDVSWFGLFLRGQFAGISRTSLKQKTVQKFAQRSLPVSEGDWGWGFMLPTLGSASCGKYFSEKSFGHTGFTGTSWWYDPTQDLSVSLLSNRVFLGRENKEFVKLRPQIHNWIVEGLRFASRS